MPGTLVVRQTPDVHAQIHGLLEDLRLNTKSLVHIETRFIEVEDSFLEDIGVDLRGLDGSLTGGFPLEDFGQSGAGGFGTPNNPTGIGTGNDPGFYYGGDNGDLKGRIENLYDFSLGEPGTINGAGGLSLQALFLDDTNVQAVLRAVTKYQTSNVVNAPSLTLRSGQRGNVKQLTTRTYVRDFEPEIAQAAVIAQPELDNVKEGVILDVRAVASADRRFVTLELRPTIIDLVPDESGNPLPQETVSLATQNSSDVTIELPELRIQRLRTTATIPDGATLMLGGLKKAIEEEQTSTVPFLGDIPVLGSLFSRQGEYTSKRKLIILLKASILNPEENEPTLGARR
jgi:general secretion pathway protein D